MAIKTLINNENGKRMKPMRTPKYSDPHTMNQTINPDRNMFSISSLQFFSASVDDFISIHKYSQ